MAIHDIALSERAIQIYHGWHDLAVSKYGSGVIDTDAAPLGATPLEFNDLGEVQAAILDLSHSTEIPEQPQLVPARFAASLLLLRALDGEQIGFHEYVETLMGITPVALDEAEILSERDELVDYLRSEGLRFDISDSETFAKQFRLVQGRAALGAAFQNYVELGCSQIAAITGEPQVHISTAVLSEDRAWTGRYITDAQGRPQMFINAHPRHTFTDSKIKLNAFHEPAHAMHFDMLRRGIAAGSIQPPFIGITTLHGPEQIHLEAVSQLTEQILMRRSGTFEDTFQAMFTRYRARVLQNAHYHLNTDHDFQAVEDYAVQRLPFEPLENIRGSLDERRNDPIRRAYYYGYGPAFKLVEAVLNDPPDIQDKRLTQLYQFLGTADEVLRAVHGSQA